MCLSYKTIHSTKEEKKVAKDLRRKDNQDRAWIRKMIKRKTAAGLDLKSSIHIAGGLGYYPTVDDRKSNPLQPGAFWKRVKGCIGIPRSIM